MDKDCGTCGMHLCSKCAGLNAIFGLIFLAVGANLFNLGNMVNGWEVVGIYLFLWGLGSMMMKK